jgi:hypothetical protein
MVVLACADPLVDVIGPPRFRAWPSGGPDFRFRCHENGMAYPFLISQENTPAAAYVRAAKSPVRSSPGRLA